MAKVKPKVNVYWALAYWSSGAVIFLSVGSTFTNFFMSLWVSRLLKPVGYFDNGAALRVLACMSSVGVLVGVFGMYVAAKCAKRNLAYTLRYSIHSYLGWGIGLALVCLSAAVCVIVMSDNKKAFVPALKLTSYANDSYIRNAIDSMQSNLRCCGYRNHTEWFHVEFSVMVKSGEVGVPVSCCSKPERQCVLNRRFDDASALTAHKNGCLEAANRHYAKLLKIVSGVLLALVVCVGLTAGLVLSQAVDLDKMEPTETSRLVGAKGQGQGQDPTKPGEPIRKYNMMRLNLKHEMASIQSFFEPPGLSTSQFFGREASALSIGPTDDQKKTSAVDIGSKDDKKKTNALDIGSKDDKKKTNALDIGSKDDKKKTSALDIGSKDDKKKTSALDIVSNDAKKKASGLDIISKDTKEKTSGLNIASKDTKVTTNGLDIVSKDTKEKTSGLNIASKDTKVTTSGLNIASTDTKVTTSAQDIGSKDPKQEPTQMTSP